MWGAFKFVCGCLIALVALGIVGSLNGTSQTEVPASPSARPKVAAKSKKSMAKEDFSKPPSLIFPGITLWKPDFVRDEICNPPTGKCKRTPTADFFCVAGANYDALLTAGHTIVSAGQSCRKWGENYLAREMRGESATPPPRSTELKAAVQVLEDYEVHAMIHVSWLDGHDPGHYVQPPEQPVCFSSADRTRVSDFYADILMRCQEWGPPTSP
jgi:hypothetical protein